MNIAFHRRNVFILWLEGFFLLEHPRQICKVETSTFLDALALWG